MGENRIGVDTTMDNETRVQHESFGFIKASRVSGQAQLFDSAVDHQHYVTIEIGQAEQVRRYNESYVHGGTRGGFISVAMSESQFAQFITSMNVGSGAPCTIQYVAGKRREPPPPDTNTRETFENEVKEQAVKIGADLVKAIAELRGLVDNGKAGKKDLQAALAKFEFALRGLDSNMPFMMRRFAEGIEKLTDRAKMDLNAHAVMLGQRLVMDENAMAEQTLIGSEDLS